MSRHPNIRKRRRDAGKAQLTRARREQLEGGGNGCGCPVIVRGRERVVVHLEGCPHAS